MAQVETAGREYLQDRRLFVDGLADRHVTVGGTKGMQILAPEHDEAAAIVRLASQGIGVSAGAPYPVVPQKQGYVRVTAGIVATGHDDLADRIADAAHASGPGSRTR